MMPPTCGRTVHREYGVTWPTGVRIVIFGTGTLFHACATSTAAWPARAFFLRRPEQPLFIHSRFGRHIHLR